MTALQTRSANARAASFAWEAAHGQLKAAQIAVDTAVRLMGQLQAAGVSI